MSKICIFNTQVDVDSTEQPYASVIPIAPDPPAPTKSVRTVMSTDCSIEFIFTDAFPGASFELRWWREFWTETSKQTRPPPTGRVITGIDPDTTWSREMEEKPGVADGEILNEPMERKTTLIIPDGKPGVAVKLDMKVFAPWMRISLYAPGQVVPGPGDISGDGPYNLFIAVITDGHDEDNFLEDPDKNNKPYAYNAGGTSIL